MVLMNNLMLGLKDLEWEIILVALKDTLLMTIVSTSIAYLIGLPLGIILYNSSKKGLRPNPVLNAIIGTFANIFRSIPCLMIIVLLIPIQNFIFGNGSWTGSWFSMLLPLVVSSFAFIARIVEQSLCEVDNGIIEASKSLGANDFQIITKVLLSEAKPSLISGFAVTIVSILGYTSFAGYISSGGLIFEAFNFGYYGDDTLGMWMCILFIIVIVQIIQEGGLMISKKIDKRRK